jgi:hypothetical protein
MKKNNSMIYKSLCKNGYSKFKLEILEYCELDNLIEREQYYLDTLKPEYNILKTAGSLTGFKHSMATRELMSIKKMNSTLSPEARLKIANLETGEILSFVSIRKAAEYIGVHHSLLAKYIKLNKFYLGKGYLVYLSSNTADEILNIEESKVVTIIESKAKHTESSKELIRKANIGKTLSLETRQNAKPVLVTNNETKETLEFPSAVAAGKFLGVDESYVRRCIISNRSCKGHTITRKSTD